MEEKRMQRRRGTPGLAWRAGPLALLLVLAGCGQAGPSASVPAETGPAESAVPSTTPEAAVESLRAGMVGDESTLNPYTYVTGFPGWNLLMLQYDSLLQFDVNGEPQPWLASGYEVSADGLTYTVTLVDGVTWNDGTPFTADDVKFTVDYFQANTQSRFTRDLSGVASVTVDAPNKVTITLTSPNPSFPIRALADVPIIPKHIWESVTTPAEATFDSPTNVGTGPYKLVEYVADQSYRFVANETYFRGAPAVKELVLVQYADEAGIVAALRTGDVQAGFRSISPEQVEALAAAPGIDVAQGPEFTTQMLYFDVTKAPFDQLAVRQAISLAIDRQDMVNTVYLGKGTVGNSGWTHPSSPFFNAAVATTTDVARANALLDEAGLTDSNGDGIREFDGNPMSFELLAPSDNPLRLRLAELSREMLAQIGIDAVVTSIERDTLVNRVWPDFDVSKGRDYEMSIFGWSAPVQVDPAQITALVASDPAVGSINIAGFKNAEADRLSGEILVEGDPTRRKDLLGQLQALVADQVPFVMLLYPDGNYAYNADAYDGWAFIAGQGVVNKLSFLQPDSRP
ncbi:MAG: ABC transporter substrate-binding protein [Anaerolinea sp.]|nr:ABC transporter substrate-binding protein [Anaerolinea sp.]